MAGIAALFGARCVLANAVPVTVDESLHWLQGKHLDWGFADHPPGTALLSWLSTALLGDTALGVRAPALLASLACSWVAWAMLRELGAPCARAAAGALMVQLLPVVAIGALMVPVAPHAPLVFAAEWLLLRALRRGRLTDYALAGTLLGLAALTYYLAALAVLAALAFLLGDARGRQALRSPGPWLAAATALGVFAPHLWWNLVHGRGGGIHFQLQDRHASGWSPVYPVAFVALGLALGGPLLLAAIAPAGRALRRGAGGHDDWRRFLGAFVLVPIGVVAAVSMVTRVGAHWAVLAYLNAPVLLLVPGLPPIGRGLRRATALVGAGALAAAALVSAFGLDAVVSAAPGVSAARRERFLHFGAAAAHVRQAAADAQQSGRQVQIAASRWGLAAALSFQLGAATPIAVLPPPDRHGRDLAGWTRVPSEAVELIYVTTAPGVEPSMRAAAAGLELVAVAGGAAPHLWVYRCPDFVAPASWR